MKNIEKQRDIIQKKLDSQKEQSSRNILGQYSTPYSLAVDIMQNIKQYLNNKSISFLEPAIGTGVFFSAFLDCFDSNENTTTGYEIDPHYFNPTKELWKGYNVDLFCQDFLKQEPIKQFDLIVTNPPYSRHHHIPYNDKKIFQQKVFDETGIKISGLAGLYCYFVLLSTKWLKEGGLSVWLIPSEFMNVGYGRALKEYLLSKVDLISIHRFRPEDLQFSDALVTSSIVVFKKQPPSRNPILFTSGEKISAPVDVIKVSRDTLKLTPKWLNIFDNSITEGHPKSCIGDYFKVSRGLATGDNKYFILDSKKVELYKIPNEFLIPILPSPRNMKHNIVDKMKIQNDPLYLFVCEKSEDELKHNYPNVLKYIEYGYDKKVNNGYICKHRKVWYCCETISPAPFYMSYMSRSVEEGSSFRFILNETDAIVTNSYLCLYPLPRYKSKLNDRKTRKRIWDCLSQIPFKELVSKGRVYGGGLYKMEPHELLSVCVPELDRILNGNNND